MDKRKLAKKAFKASAAVSTMGGSVVAERLAKKAVKAVKRDDKATPPMSRRAPTETETRGPTPSGPETIAKPKKFKGDTYMLPAGYDLEFHVNVARSAEYGEEALLGKKRKNAEVEERRLQVFISRDTDAKSKNSVRVDLSDGRPLGWIGKHDAENVCVIIDGVSKLRKRRDRSKDIRLQATLEVDGEWEDGEPYISRATIQIKEPVNAKLVD
jgi:hypothetical protein